MSLETLLEAARFVEQQELRAQQYQNLLNNNRTPFKIISSVTVSHNQTPPATLVAVPQVSTIVQQQSSPILIAAAHQNVSQPSRQSATIHQVQNTPVMVATTTTTQPGQNGQPGVVEVIQKPLPPPTTITVQPQQIQTITNGFDKATALLLEETQQMVQNQDLKKRSHANGPGAISGPISGTGSGGMLRSGTREVHNKLEKNRRAHLKECFELLKKQLPQQQDEKKTSNLSILHSALRHIQGLRKRERENEHEMERLARDKIAYQQRLATLKKELGPQLDNIDFTALIQPPEPPLLSIASTTTTTHSNVVNSSIMTIAPPQNPIKDEFYDEDEPTKTQTRVTNILTNGNTNTTATMQPVSVPMLPLPQVGYHPVGVGVGVGQGLVLGVQKVALVSSKNLPLVSSPIAHILPQLNGKVVPLMNAQYLMKPVVVVSSPNQGNTNITPRPS